jgi:3-phenylpropionate/trans-cinnamate dioxygenase ferredoxin subunit
MAGWVKVAKVSEVPAGRVKVVTAGGHRIALCNCDGAIYAIDDLCTHDGGPLDQGELLGCEIECPRHGAHFDVRTGAALTLPAVFPVATYAVRVVGDDIEVLPEPRHG